MPDKPITGFELSQLVWKIPLADLPGRPERSILRALADHYPKIWPSVENLGAAPGYSRSHTAAALRKLEALKLITVKYRFRKNGSKQSSDYSINVFAVMKLALKNVDASPKTGDGAPEIGGGPPEIG